MYVSGDPIPDGAGGFREFESVPDALLKHRWTEKYGNPNAGGWLDQPYLFFMEVRAAQAAIDEFRAIKKVNNEIRRTTVG